MKEKWELLENKFNALGLRERLLISITILVIIYVVWDFAFYRPLAQKNSNLHARLSLTNTDIAKVSAEEKIFAQALTNDPNASRKREIVRLEQKLNEMDTQLEQLSVGLIQADKLPQVLHDVLFSSDKLKLLGMKTSPVEKLSFAQPETAAEQLEQVEEPEKIFNDQPEETVSVFKHTVTISLEGRYFDVVNYLTVIEKLPWKIYWEFLDYRVVNYPNAKVILQVYTLTTEMGVLGA